MCDPAAEAGSPPQTLIDGHVHIHRGVDPAAALDAAVRNMARDAAGPAVTGALLLTESAGVDAFAALPDRLGPWRITRTDEAVSRIARHDDGRARLTLVAGRQIVTAEGLEVHGFGLAQAIPDGMPAAAALAAVQTDGALAALPWGFGKWTGRRGGVLRDLIRSGPPGFYLADSGARMAGTPRPALLAEGEAAGRLVLAGTDPLPLAGGAAKIGRFGMIADVALDEGRPFASFKSWAQGLTASPRCYGRLESPLAFGVAQIKMQARKRLGAAG